MTKAFWSIVPNDDSIPNERKPDIPVLPSVEIRSNPCELWILPEGAAPAAHRHLLIGSLAAPTFQVASKHTHIAFRHGAFSYQRLIHETQAQHTHPDPQLAFFMCFVVCSDADYAVLTSAPYNIRAVCHADITVEDGEEVIGDLDTAAWTAGQRTAWENAVLTNLGIALPNEIDRGRRLVAFLLEMGLARRNDHERGLR